MNQTQKCHRLLWVEAHLRRTEVKWESVLLSDESTFEILFGNHGNHVVLWAKEERGHPASYQQTVHRSASVMLRGCISAHETGNLHFFEGTIENGRCMQDLGQHLLPCK